MEIRYASWATRRDGFDISFKTLSEECRSDLRRRFLAAIRRERVAGSDCRRLLLAARGLQRAEPWGPFKFSSSGFMFSGLGLPSSAFRFSGVPLEPSLQPRRTREKLGPKCEVQGYGLGRTVT